MFKKKKIKFLLLFIISFIFLLCLKEGMKEISQSQDTREKEIETSQFQQLKSDEDIVKNEIEIEEEKEAEELEQPEEEIIVPSAKILENVPFTSQAPFGDWEDPRQQHGCEEASIVMAYYWAIQKELTLENALSEIFAISEFEVQKFGHYYDTSTEDTTEVFREFYDYENVSFRYDITLEDIKKEIAQGNLVLVPTNGRKLQNPHYTAPGPLLHEVVVIGYDDQTQEFITHDPGTRFGENYRYDYDIFMSAIRDYKTGTDEPVEEERKAMIVITK